MNKFLVSGIEPNYSGVGRLITILAPTYKAMGYTIIYPSRNAKPIKNLLLHRYYICVIRELLLRFLYRLHFDFRCLFIFNSDIIYIHPQTAGFAKLIYLTFFNRVSLYTMDSSFFCILSYNTYPNAPAECLNCLSEINPLSCCQLSGLFASPLRVFFLRILKLRSHTITFLAQNALQQKLLQAHFGNEVKSLIIGMPAESRAYVNQLNIPTSFSRAYDLVFHGASKIPKGIIFFIEISILMPDYSFLIPDSLSNVMKIFSDQLPPNLHCNPMTWETGLREHVYLAKVVVNPSIWSAPIEGALVKSAAFNKNVATIKSQYGFENEIDFIRNHIRLPLCPVSSAAILSDFLSNNHD
jgi:hypothetical protein